MEYTTLNNGVRMPVVGLGTFNLPKKELTQIVRAAFDLGYTKFDTAWKYKNEKELGNAFKKLGIPRDKLFITTKFHIDQIFLSYHPSYHIAIPRCRVKHAFELQCKNLMTDYIDLYLLHWPFLNYYEKIWEEVVDLYKSGRIRALGVCSFDKRHLNKLREISDVVPAVNQIEVSPYNTQKGLVTFTQSQGIQVEGYSSFGGHACGSNTLFTNEVLSSIACEYGKSVPQIINRWLIQQNIDIIPRSKNPMHLKENLDIFDFKLSQADMEKIDALNRDEFVYGNPKYDYYK